MMGNWFGSYFCDWFGAAGGPETVVAERVLNRTEAKAPAKSRLREDEEEALVLLAAAVVLASGGLS